MLVDLAQAFAKCEASNPGLKTWLTATRTWPMTWPADARVLEIGCSVADWLSMACHFSPGIQGVAIDWQGPKRGPGKRLKGDVLDVDFGPERFDVIVAVSTLEHIGLGHYDKDPLAEDGDARTFARAAGWLAPGGWFYADVPYDPAGYQVFGTKCRIYDDAALDRVFSHPALRLRARLYTDLSGNLVPKPAPTWQAPDRSRPFLYVVSLWDKETADGTPTQS